MKKHIHCDVIKAWADGAEVEYWDNAGKEWCKTLMPSFHSDYKYRVKPPPAKKYNIYVSKEDKGSYVVEACSSQDASFSKRISYLLVAEGIELADEE